MARKMNKDMIGNLHMIMDVCVFAIFFFLMIWVVNLLG